MNDDDGFRRLRQRDPAHVPGNDAVVMGSSVATAVGVVVFVVAVVLRWPVEGQLVALAVAFLGFLVGFRRYFGASYPQVEAAEPRPELPDELEPVRELMPMSRRRLLTRALAAAAGTLGLAALVPVASLGPRYRPPQTGWRAGVRLVTGQGAAVRPEDLPAGSATVVWPERAAREEHGAVMLLRLSADAQAPTRLDWVVDRDVVAYSQVCTHAGCPVGLFRPTDNALYCPCHQAQFDVARGATPVFGPASRPLAQLPLGVDDEGHLTALGDFEQPVGPPRGA